MKKRTVVVYDQGYIKELGNKCGPIYTPFNLDITTIRKMVARGGNVFACDPKDPGNTSKRVKLTMQNYKDEKLFGGAAVQPKTEEKQVEPKPVEQPKKEEKKPQQEQPKTEEKQVEPKPVEQPKKEEKKNEQNKKDDQKK